MKSVIVCPNSSLGALMSLSDLASLGSFVSGLAILVSLIFVAWQLRQNTEAVRASSSQAHEVELHDVLRPIIENDDVAELFRIGFERGLRALSDNQRVRYMVIMSGISRYYQASWLRWHRGRLDKAQWHSVESNFRDLFPHAGFQEYWRVRQNWYSPEFRAWVDSLPKATPERGLYDLPAS